MHVSWVVLFDGASCNQFFFSAAWVWRSSLTAVAVSSGFCAWFNLSISTELQIVMRTQVSTGEIQYQIWCMMSFVVCSFLAAGRCTKYPKKSAICEKMDEEKCQIIKDYIVTHSKKLTLHTIIEGVSNLLSEMPQKKKHETNIAIALVIFGIFHCVKFALLCPTGQNIFELFSLTRIYIANIPKNVYHHTATLHRMSAYSAQNRRFLVFCMVSGVWW